MHQKPGTLIIGCGNLLRGDDGAGPVLVRHLWEAGLPDGVHCADGGTGGMDVAFQMRGVPNVILVDACRSGSTPGTLFRLPADEVEQLPPLTGINLHAFRWDHALSAMAVDLARQQGITNFSVLVSHVLVPPAIAAIMSSPNVRVQAFLAAGHVCSVMGYWEYPILADRFHVPIVITGFEPLDVLQGILSAVRQLERGEARVENAYERVVTYAGNVVAQQLLSRVFQVEDRTWRGIGSIPQSGWKLSPAYREFDAETRFSIGQIDTRESPLCHSGEVLQGMMPPTDCPAFGKQCTPRTPLGATMVSNEGACAAYFNYGRMAASKDLVCLNN